MWQSNDFFDKSALESLSEDCGEDVVRTLISLYKTEAPVLLERIVVGLETGAASDVEISSHSLKSSSAALGAVKIAKLCAEIESKSNLKNLTDGKELAAETAKELQRFVQFLV